MTPPKKKAAKDWTALASRPGAVVDGGEPSQTEQLDLDDSPPSAPPSAPPVPAAPTTGRRLVPTTYKISQRSADLISPAVGQAMMAGQTITREGVVEAALWATYGDGKSAPDDALPSDRGSTVPKTYRLTEDAIALLNRVVGERMMTGHKYTRGEAVEAALWSTYGHLAPPDVKG